MLKTSNAPSQDEIMAGFNGKKATPFAKRTAAKAALVTPDAKRAAAKKALESK